MYSDTKGALSVIMYSAGFWAERSRVSAGRAKRCFQRVLERNWRRGRIRVGLVVGGCVLEVGVRERRRSSRRRPKG